MFVSGSLFGRKESELDGKISDKIEIIEKVDVDQLLEEVKREARALSIPFSQQTLEQVVLNRRAKKRFGCCKKTGQGYIIEISEMVLSCEEKIIKQILAHELLHTCKDCYNHSPKWKAYAALMNEAYGYEIKRTCSREELGLQEVGGGLSEFGVKYRLQCMDCGKVIQRQRKSRLIRYPWLYRCRCGGKLKRI